MFTNIMKLITGLLAVTSVIGVSVKQGWGWSSSPTYYSYSPSYFDSYPFGYGYYSTTPGPTWTVGFRKENNADNEKINKEIKTIKTDLFKDQSFDISSVRKERKAFSFEFLKNEIKYTRLLQL